MISMATQKQEWGCNYKNIHISAATHPRTLNLVSNQLLDLAHLHDGWLCKYFNFHIHKF